MSSSTFKQAICTLFFFLHISGISCAPAASNALTINTPLGRVKGTSVTGNVTRFTVPFAQPPLGDLRFANPVAVSSFGSYDTTQTPPSCFQNSGDARGGNPPSEDCLYATWYFPSSSPASSTKRPVLVWVHGGSGIAGSSTLAGLDGASWASSQDVIVVLLQYRLGMFGWLQTGSTLDEANGGGRGATKVAGNQAIRDVVTALGQVRNLADAVGGDPSKVTLIGQSSGAGMVRALLSTPSAQSLFNNAIIISDPENYGPSSIADNNALGEYGMQSLNCSLSDLKCARAADAQAVYDATLDAYSTVPSQNPRIAGGTPWRSMVGQYIPRTIDLNPSSSGSKSVIFTTVANEAGSVAGHFFARSEPGASMLTFNGGGTVTLAQAADIFFNAERGTAAANDTTSYPPTSPDDDGLRRTLETLATDGLWRCGTQRNAVNVAQQNGGSKIYLAQWQVAAKYPSNSQNDYCTSNGNVCHEDDIYVIFGTTPASTANPALSGLTREIQTRYASFARTGNPSGPSGSTNWPAVASRGNLNLLLLGRRGDSSASGARTFVSNSQRPRACQALWGQSVKFDSQLYPA